MFPTRDDDACFVNRCCYNVARDPKYLNGMARVDRVHYPLRFGFTLSAYTMTVTLLTTELETQVLPVTVTNQLESEGSGRSGT